MALLYFSARREVMGKLVNKKATTVIGVAIGGIMLVLTFGLA